MLRISQFNPARCLGCEEVHNEDNLMQGYCQECLNSGMIKSCPNCSKYFHEDTGVQGYCPECGDSFFQFDQHNQLTDIH